MHAWGWGLELGRETCREAAGPDGAHGNGCCGGIGTKRHWVPDDGKGKEHK